MQETQFRSLGQEDPLLEKEMATHSGILAWRIPWTEDPGGLQSMGSQGDTPEWLTLSALLLVFQAGGHSPVIWGHSNLTSPGLSPHSTGAGNLWSRPERELLTELVWAGQPSWAWPCHCSPSPPSIKVGGSGRLPPSPNPRKWLASSLLLQSHPPPAIYLLGFTFGLHFERLYALGPWRAAMNTHHGRTSNELAAGMNRDPFPASSNTSRPRRRQTLTLPLHVSSLTQGPLPFLSLPHVGIDLPRILSDLLTRNHEVETHMQRAVSILLCHPGNDDF